MSADSNTGVTINVERDSINAISDRIVGEFMRFPDTNTWAEGDYGHVVKGDIPDVYFPWCSDQLEILPNAVSRIENKLTKLEAIALGNGVIAPEDRADIQITNICGLLERVGKESSAENLLAVMMYADKYCTENLTGLPGDIEDYIERLSSAIDNSLITEVAANSEEKLKVALLTEVSIMYAKFSCAGDEFSEEYWDRSMQMRRGARNYGTTISSNADAYILARIGIDNVDRLPLGKLLRLDGLASRLSPQQRIYIYLNWLDAGLLPRADVTNILTLKGIEREIQYISRRPGTKLGMERINGYIVETRAQIEHNLQLLLAADIVGHTEKYLGHTFVEPRSGRISSLLQLEQVVELGSVLFDGILAGGPKPIRSTNEAIGMYNQIIDVQNPDLSAIAILSMFREFVFNGTSQNCRFDSYLLNDNARIFSTIITLEEIAESISRICEKEGPSRSWMKDVFNQIVEKILEKNSRRLKGINVREGDIENLYELASVYLFATEN